MYGRSGGASVMSLSGRTRPKSAACAGSLPAVISARNVSSLSPEFVISMKRTVRNPRSICPNASGAMFGTWISAFAIQPAPLRVTDRA